MLHDDLTIRLSRGAAACLKKLAASDETRVVTPAKALTVPASAAWYSAKPPAPKSIKPSTGAGSDAKTRTPAKPPSKLSFYRDQIKANHDPQRGFRISLVG